MDFFLRIVDGPFWWLTYGAKNFFLWIRRQVKIMFYGLSVRVLWKNLLSPLYGATKWYEHMISFVVRSGYFLVIFTFAALIWISMWSLFLVYLAVPFAPLLFLWNYRLPVSPLATSFFLYGAMFFIYLFFREKTKPSLKIQVKGKRKHHPLSFAKREVYRIFRQKKALKDKIKAVFASKSGAEVMMRLEFENKDLPINFTQKTLLKNALQIAIERGKRHLHIVDIMEAMWRENKGDKFWHQSHLGEVDIQELFDFYQNKESLFNFQNNWSSYAIFQGKNGIDRGLTSKLNKNVNEFTRDVSQVNSSREITPLVGREKEWNHILKIMKYKGSAALLVAKSGAGKSSIIQHLANQIAADFVPPYLQDSRLVELDVGRILSSNNRNKVSENFINTLDEIAAASHILLTIDNLASLIGKDSSYIFLLGILSKYLERKKIRIIATSTKEDYEKFLLRNSTYIRWFTKIFLKEFPPADIKKILSYHAINLERKYGTIISQRCFKVMLEIAEKHITNLSQPASSLHILEETVAANSHKSCIGSEDVKRTLEKNTGIKITKVDDEERKMLANLENEIHKTIVSQDLAVNKVSDALRRARLDLHHYEGPIAKFLFVGPTGVGKTELAKTVARIHFGSEKKMLRLDMSEFQNIDSIKQLLGDGENPGVLTEPVQTTAHMLVLFDEIEKAHPNILHLFLQLLDDGRITDSCGRIADFRNTIIIATSNAGAEFLWTELKKRADLEEIAKKLKEEILVQHFKPEFLNRFSHITVFHPLMRDDVIKIAGKLLLKAQKTFQKKKLNIHFTKDAAQLIANDSFTFEMGARPLKHAITDRLESQLAKLLLKKENEDQKDFIFNGRVLEKASARALPAL